MDDNIPAGHAGIGGDSSEGTVRASLRVCAVFLMVLFLLQSVASAEFYIEDASDGTIFENGDQVRFVAETEEQANFTVNITQTGLEIARFELSLQEQFEEENETVYRYTSPYRMNKSEFGVQEAHLWRNSSYNESGTTLWNYTYDSNLSYRVTGDDPTIISLRDYPSLKFTESSIFVEVGIADSEEDVSSALVDVDSRTISMNQTDSRDNFQEFRANFTINDTGRYEYSVTVQDNGSLQNSAGGVFSVEKAPSKEDTDLRVSVDRECYNVTSTLSAPGNEPINVIKANTTGAFLGEFYNSGSIWHDLRVSLDVTDEGEDAWDPGEEIGPVLVSYEPKVMNLTALNTSQYFRQFRAVYEPGNYTGRMYVDSQCRDEEDNVTKNYNFTVTDNFRIVDVEGEDSFLTNGTQTVNQSIPKDVSRRGAESDRTLEGDNPEPGSTVRPEPEPRPALSLDMETINLSYSSRRGRYQEVGLNITNFAENATLSDIRIEPQVDDLNGDWEFRDASIAQISPSQRLTRQVYLRPGTDVSPGNYRIPVIARITSGRALDVEYIPFTVTEEEIPESNLAITEIPRTISVQRNSTTTVPVLVENTGDTELQDVSLSVQNLDQCGDISVDPINSLEPNESATLQAELSSADRITECQTLFVLSAENGAYSFADVNIQVTAEEGIVPPEFRVPLLAFAWTAILVLYAVLSRRYGLDSMLVKLPFLMLILGESVIVLYLAANYYGIIPAGLLPF